MIYLYYKDKKINDLFESSDNENKIQNVLDFIKNNQSLGDNCSLTDLATKIYKDKDYSILDNSQKQDNKNHKENSIDKQSGMPTEIEKASVVVQDAENK